MTIFLEDSFDSAHYLPNVPDGHKCKRMHGHTYRIRIEITGLIGTQTGWVVDYSDVKEIWNPIKCNLDHQNLNDILDNPTCELLAQWIADRFAYVGVHPSKIELRETMNCGVVWAR